MLEKLSITVEMIAITELLARGSLPSPQTPLRSSDFRVQGFQELR